MDLAVQLLAAAGLATAEFCADPFEGGVEEPQFCRLYSSQDISTPYFSITVEPDFLIGVDRDGRRLQVQPTLWQSPAVLTVERIEGSNLPNWSDCPTIDETVEENVTWHDCRKTENGFHERRLIAKLYGAYILIEYSYGALGATLAPALERMTQSIRIHAI
jgi:hypothetical protein